MNTDLDNLPKRAATARATFRLDSVHRVTKHAPPIVVTVTPMNGPRFRRDFHVDEWIEFARENPPEPPKTIRGKLGRISIDWNKNAELRWIARDDIGMIFGTWPADVTAAEVAEDLKTKDIPNGTRLSIRKEELTMGPGGIVES